ncbi:heme exporter protein CcmD [Haematospirillum sp. H1815]|nr:heme exporter protein CcmD [Haematospirillum sp. H1815]
MDMGGYGVYVWPAYALTALVLLSLLASSLYGLRRRRRMLEHLRQAYAGPDAGQGGKDVGAGLTEPGSA